MGSKYLACLKLSLRSTPTMNTSAKYFPARRSAVNRRSRSFSTPLTTTSLISGKAFSNAPEDRKSTRLNSSHLGISYAVFCLKKKKKQNKKKIYQEHNTTTQLTT